nr:MAG: ORF1 [TTV-like mini virus]
MPPYWRQRRRRWTRRYRWPTTRRPRKTFRRRWYTRRRKPYWRRRVRKLFLKRKLKKISLVQWQPSTIRKCKIKGHICLFQGSPERANNNYIQWIYSYVPVEEPGGGGWTLIIESLSSLWEDWQHLKNIWTESNAGLPLVRYEGVTLTFWQSEYTDYIAEVTNCYPMVDTRYTHADAAPSRMLLKKNVIRVPSRVTRKKKRPYKKRFFHPPSQMQNKWYFQKDICNIPLIMVTATAVDFRYPFCGSECKSNNLTLVCLNTAFFQFHNFDNYPPTTGYFPKPSVYMYSHAGRTTAKPTKESLIYLGDTKTYTQGTPPSATKDYKDPSNWGNPFWHHYIDGSLPVYTASKPPTQLTDTDIQGMTPMAEDYFFTVRYNPEKDTGATNKIYIVENFNRSDWHEPANPNLKLEGFPLYDMCWGFLDWLEKIHEVQDIPQHYIFVINTDVFDEKKFPYVPVDAYFRNGEGPYEAPLTNYDKAHWNIKSRFQSKSINDICLTGPGCARSPFGNYMQAKMTYNFHMKWGGCPKTLKKPYDPCSQPTWTAPSNIQTGLQIQDPNTNPQTELQEWDWRRDYISKKAIKRIQQYTEPHETLQIFTESRSNVPVHRQTPETSDSESETEKDQTPIEEKILHLQLKQRELKKRILNRLTFQNIS